MADKKVFAVEVVRETRAIERSELYIVAGDEQEARAQAEREMLSDELLDTENIDWVEVESDLNRRVEQVHEVELPKVD
jgi:hypothetical protein